MALPNSGSGKKKMWISLFLLHLALSWFSQETFAFTTATQHNLSCSYAKKCDRTFESALFAKKKKGKKQKSKKKDSGFAWAASFSSKPFESASLRDLASTACASFEGRTGKPLTEEMKTSLDIPKTLWNAPLGCVIVGEEPTDGEASATGAIIQYANIAALEMVGLKPDQFEQLLATKDPGSGEWKASEKVNKYINLPSQMKGEKTYESGYKKKVIRGGEDGADIELENAQRWVLEKSALIDGKFATETLGIAYAWNSWIEGGDTLCRSGGIREGKIDIDGIEEKIKAQGVLIREMKEGGLGNKDPEVSGAVQELLRLKASLEEAVASK